MNKKIFLITIFFLRHQHVLQNCRVKLPLNQSILLLQSFGALKKNEKFSTEKK